MNKRIDDLITKIRNRCWQQSTRLLVDMLHIEIHASYPEKEQIKNEK